MLGAFLSPHFQEAQVDSQNFGEGPRKKVNRHRIVDAVNVSLSLLITKYGRTAKISRQRGYETKN